MTTNLRHRIAFGFTAALLPAIYLGAFLILILIWRMLALPDAGEMYRSTLGWYERRGLVIVFVAAFVEGIALVGLYFPGSAVILLGVAASAGQPARAIELVAVTATAFLLAAQVNFAMGYFGLHYIIRRFGGEPLLSRAKRHYARWGNYILFVSFVHPSFGGFVAVAAGIGRLSWAQFVLTGAASIILWNAFWGVIAYQVSGLVASVATTPWPVIAFLTSWLIIAFAVGCFHTPPARC